MVDILKYLHKVRDEGIILEIVLIPEYTELL